MRGTSTSNVAKLHGRDHKPIWPPPWRWWVNSVYASDNVTASMTSRITALKDASFKSWSHSPGDAHLLRLPVYNLIN